MADGQAEEAVGEADTTRCPFCGAETVDLVSFFGSQLLTSQFRCASCMSYFEGLRDDRWDEHPGGSPGRQKEYERGNRSAD